MTYRRLSLAMVMVAAFFVGACGSSKNGSTTTTTASSTAAATAPVSTTSTVAIASGPPLSRARWIAAGDAICHRVQVQLESAKFRTSAQLERSLLEAAIFYASEAEDLRKLVPPKAMARDWEAYVNDVHLFDEYTNIVTQELKSGHRIMSALVREKIARLQADMIMRAKRDGFKWCAIGE